MMKKTAKASLIGVTAPIMWSFMPILISLSNNLPSLFILGAALLIFSLVNFLHWKIKKRNFLELLKQPLGYYIISIIGIFGFHIFYFIALKISPIVPVFFIINLASILIIIYAALILKTPIRVRHIVALTLSFFAVILIYLNQLSDNVPLKENYLWGYLSAFIAANCWALYSVISRRYNNVPRDAITYVCFIVALLSMMIFMVMDSLFIPTIKQMIIILLLGIGPMGYAFFTWNYGVCFGDIRILSICGYINPVLGVLWVVLFGFAEFHYYILLSLLLILSGAFIATYKNN